MALQALLLSVLLDSGANMFNLSFAWEAGNATTALVLTPIMGIAALYDFSMQGD